MRGTSIGSCFLIIVLLLIFITAPVYGQGEVKIGVLASRGAEETLKTWQPTAEYLSEEIPQNSFVVVPLDLVVYAVRDGKADAGTVRTGILESMASEGKINLSDFVVLNPQHDDFPLLHSTGLYPEWAFAKPRHTPDELAEKVAAAQLNMPSDSAAAMAANAVWTVPLDYQPVHELMKELRFGPYKAH